MKYGLKIKTRCKRGKQITKENVIHLKIKQKQNFKNRKRICEQWNQGEKNEENEN